MITARVTKDWTDDEGSMESVTFELTTDAGYNPDTAQDLMNRVVAAVALDRKESHDFFTSDDE